MRRLVGVLLATGIFLLSSINPVLAAEEQAYIYFTAPVADQSATKAALIYQQAEGLRGFQVRITFDPKVVQVVDAQTQTPGAQVALGSLFADALVVENKVDNQKGEVVLSAAKPGAEVTGTTDLLWFELKGVTPGDPKLAIASKGLTIVDKRMKEIVVGADTGSLQVPGVGAAPVPEQTREKPLLRGTISKVTPPKPQALPSQQAGQGTLEIKKVTPNATTPSGEKTQPVVKSETINQEEQDTGMRGEKDSLGKTLTIVGAVVLAVMVAYQLYRSKRFRRRRRR